jgi:hypothetical protein
MRWQVRHSKVRSSKPRLPGEIRANPILCLQVRHIGRSTMEDKSRIAQHPQKRYVLQDVLVCPVSDSRTKFWRNSQRVAGIASESLDCQALSASPGLHGLDRGSLYTPQAGCFRCLERNRLIWSACCGGCCGRPVISAGYPFASLPKPKADPAPSASARRPGISCTTGGKSG